MLGIGIIAAVGPVLAFPALAQADPVTIKNPSFEDPAVPDGGFTIGSITDWITSGVTGVLHPLTPFHFDFVPDGLQVGYSNGGSLSQVLDDTLQANTIYTLNVDVGKRSDCCQTPFSYSVQLWAGDVLLVSDMDSVVPDPGSFATVTVTYTSSDSDPGLGQPPQIVFSADGSVQTAFDNLLLDASPASVRASAQPEPARIH